MKPKIDCYCNINSKHARTDARQNPVPFSTLSCAELLLPAFCRFLHSSRLPLPASPPVIPSSIFSRCPVFWSGRRCLSASFPCTSAATRPLPSLLHLFSSPVTVIVKRTFAIRFQKTPVFYHNTPSAFSQRERNRKAAPYLMTLPSSLILFSLMAFRTCSFSFTAAGLSAPLPDPSSEYIFPASPSPRRSWTAALC